MKGNRLTKKVKEVRKVKKAKANKIVMTKENN